MSRRSALVAVVICAQVGMPMAALVNAPSQFGFQMYSGHPAPVVAVHDVSGAELDVDHVRYTARARADVDFAQHLPEHLCTRVPGAGKVTVEWRGARRVVRC